MRRSKSELEMRDAVVAWGRDRWPEARVCHELPVGRCRADLAFVSPRHVAVVELKSERDTLRRLPDQWREFRDHVPEVWLAVDPRWDDATRNYDPRVLTRSGRVGGYYAARRDVDLHFDWTRVPRLLNLLWRDELGAIAARHFPARFRARAPRYQLVPGLARELTGTQIVAEVCRELRARRAFPAFPPSDPPLATGLSEETEDEK